MDVPLEREPSVPDSNVSFCLLDSEMFKHLPVDEPKRKGKKEEPVKRAIPKIQHSRDLWHSPRHVNAQYEVRS